MCAFFLEISW